MPTVIFSYTNMTTHVEETSVGLWIFHKNLDVLTFCWQILQTCVEMVAQVVLKFYNNLNFSGIKRIHCFPFYCFITLKFVSVLFYNCDKCITIYPI